MGHALEFLLAPRHTVTVWTRRQQDDKTVTRLDEVAGTTDVVIFCLPVNPHREVARQIAPLLAPHTVCISIAKGLDESGQTAAQIFADALPSQQPYALLYGPMISEEIRDGRYAFAQVGCTTRAVYQDIHNLFAGSSLFVSYSQDIAGISWSVILKNVYALLFGMADGLGLGDNMRGFLAVAALHELDQIVRAMGGKSGSPFHLAGLGDLITTATSLGSHHHTLGYKLGRGEAVEIRGEGVHTLAMVQKHRLFDVADYPLFSLCADIISQPQSIKQGFDAFLQACFSEA